MNSLSTLNVITDNAKRAKEMSVVKFNPYIKGSDSFEAYELGWK